MAQGKQKDSELVEGPVSIFIFRRTAISSSDFNKCGGNPIKSYQRLSGVSLPGNKSVNNSPANGSSTSEYVPAPMP
jgi:hypothetical protein